MPNLTVEERAGKLAEALGSSRRRERQIAAHEIAVEAKKHPQAFEKVMPELIEALYCTEAQTRWEILDALSEIATVAPDAVSQSYEAAEPSLFDEQSATVRLSAFHYLTVMGATSPERSDVAWPLIDEAIQCFHGDPEYRDMLLYLVDFVSGNISDATKKGLSERVAFDAENGTGYIKAYSSDILDFSKK